MTSDQLADELARLAGWKKDDQGYWTDQSACTYRNLEHPFPVGSLDALEAWRREQLPGWELDGAYRTITRRYTEWEATLWFGVHDGEPDETCSRTGPTLWDAYAAALIAAKKGEHNA